ncbi:hypothetical protein BGZ99_001422 [Dissophora globulifera]|uniref:Uncharacterized protein n=1 Tax=Dissophora globulifera TaxID=979702 RepID=A0A9P6UXU7_9FUNG|nr:hypothetical protein BGZ99_001422 [Dissophora globulifera]
MAIQTKAPSAHDGSGDRFVMDPAKGRIVVGLVSAVLAIGVIIGVCQVYSAAQYVPPPPKPKPKKAVGKVGGKKIKKKDAYFKKPVRDERSSMLLGSESGVGGNDRSSGVELDMMETNASRKAAKVCFKLMLF